MRSRLAAALLTTAAVTAVAVGSAGANPTHEVRVLHGAQTVATFTDAQCSVKHGTFEALVVKTKQRRWGMAVDIDHFSGFHAYAMRQSANSNAWLDVLSPTDVAFSNLYVPQFHAPFAGRVTFSSDHDLVGVGAYPAWNKTATDSVGVAGVLRCHWATGEDAALALRRLDG